VLDGIASLVDQSLVAPLDARGDGARFRLLEPVREFALERLEAGDETDDATRRHAEDFLAFAERGAPDLEDVPTTAWLDRLAAEHANLGAAFDRLCDPSTAHECLRLVNVCAWY